MSQRRAMGFRRIATSTNSSSSLGSGVPTLSPGSCTDADSDGSSFGLARLLHHGLALLRLTTATRRTLLPSGVAPPDSITA